MPGTSREGARRGERSAVGPLGALGCALLGGVLWVSGRGLPPAMAAPPPLTGAVVRLKPQVETLNSTVRLGDVAEVSAADATVERQLRNVDLLDLTEPSGVQRVGRRFIDLRLQLAGFDSAEYELVGPVDILLCRSTGAVTTTTTVRPTDTALEEAARSELSRVLHVPEAELRVTLSTPVMESLLSGVAATDDVRIDVVPRGQPGLGQVALVVRVFTGEKLTASRVVQFDVARQTPVLVAAVTLARGEMLTAAALREERRFLVQATESLSIDQAVGQKIVCALAAGEILQSRHLMRPVGTSEPTLIQARDPVRVTARKQGLVVVLRNAEAIQAGRAGQLIRVRNTDTNQVIVGRVVAAGEVEVSFD